MEDTKEDLGRYSSPRKENMDNEKQPKVTLTPWERETHVSFSDDSTECTVFTCNKTLWSKLEKLGYVLVRSTETSRTFQCTKKCISFRSNIEKPKRVLTEAQKQALEKARQKQ